MLANLAGAVAKQVGLALASTVGEKGAEHARKLVGGNGGDTLAGLLKMTNDTKMHFMEEMNKMAYIVAEIQQQLTQMDASISDRLQNLQHSQNLILDRLVRSQVVEERRVLVRYLAGNGDESPQQVLTSLDRLQSAIHGEGGVPPLFVSIAQALKNEQVTKEQILHVISEFYWLWNLQAAVLDKLFHEANDSALIRPRMLQMCSERLADQQSFNPALFVGLRETFGVLKAEGRYDGSFPNNPEGNEWNLALLTFHLLYQHCHGIYKWPGDINNDSGRARFIKNQLRDQGVLPEDLIDAFDTIVLKVLLSHYPPSESLLYKPVLQTDLQELRTRLVTSEVCSGEFFDKYKEMVEAGTALDMTYPQAVRTALLGKLDDLKKIHFVPNAGAGGYPQQQP